MRPWRSDGERTGLAAFAGCCLPGGGDAVGVRFGNRELDPLWGASRGAYVFGAIPVVTILLSSRLDDEELTVGLLLGAPLVMAGVHLGAPRPGRHRETPEGRASPAVRFGR
ncbi:DMT family transporter [Streptomyces sp. ISL-94]|uniref:DMT family transporter n=1 Tax=Streptomyces sp. ISL-94 TaxID=2819190 RepID=UPI001BE9B919|nr:DMT family transporter [Streptomyces sp. ISL-94]MBT2478399.1 hypothetical protein [Streptomyces sp. ISL-94]